MKTITPLILLLLSYSGCSSNDGEMKTIDNQAFCTDAYAAVVQKHLEIEDFEKLLINVRGAAVIQVTNSIAQEKKQIKILIESYEEGNCIPDAELQEILNKY